MYLKLFSMPQITFFNRRNVLYCRVRLNGTTSEFSTKQKIIPEYWNQSNQMYSGKSKAENSFLETYINGMIFKLKSKALATPNILTASDLLRELTTDFKPVLLSSIVEKYISGCKTSEGTIRNHTIKLQNLQQFELFTKTKFYPETFTMKTAHNSGRHFTKSETVGGNTTKPST